MRTIDTYGSFEDILGASNSTAQELARKLRALIIDVFPAVVEVPWPRQHVAGYGVGPRKMSEHFCYIAAHRDYVNLGFYYGAELPDPDGLLGGPGKLLRHIKLVQLADIKRPGLRMLLERARTYRMPEPDFSGAIHPEP